MSTALTHPLQALIQHAAQQTTTGTVSQWRQRQAQATEYVVILADVSASMGESVGAGTKVEILRDALTSLWPQMGHATLMAFSSSVHPLSTPQALPRPSGNTALHLALLAAQPFFPGQTLVISDGHPDSEEAALAVADQLTGRIDVLYCGPEDDQQAIRFLQRLARSTGGRYVSAPRLAAGGMNFLEPVQRLLLTEGPCATP